jgi:hypothetical protein
MAVVVLALAMTAFATHARQPLPGAVHDLTAVRIWGIVR